jgi:glucokinase
VPLFIGGDVGGTKVLAAAVSTSGRLVRTARRSTPGRSVDAAVVEDALTEAVRDVARGRRVDGVGIAATVVLDNDANCTARAECTYGAARGASDVIVVTLGTGIGGAVVIDGRVHRGSNGMAGEFGHMQVVPDGLPCECGGRGCWEQYSSGNALARYARARLDGSVMLRELCQGDPDQLTGPMVTGAAEAGDPLALEAFGSVGRWLGVGLANLVAAFDPDVMVVGGGVSAAGDLLLEPARAALGESLVGAGHRVVPPVLRATLGPEAGAVGAADLARTVVRGEGRWVRSAGSRGRARRRAARGTAPHR